MSINEELLKSYKHSLELANERIAELSEPTVKSSAHTRSAERDFLKKKVKYYEAKIKELEK
ncbi:hypothetical protein QM799_08695 [Streptococcus infantis]|uniref:hypothetical protein n=1 Tax=Streptococcus infantis TaxID=68892 RepID=UPI0039C0E5C1